MKQLMDVLVSGFQPFVGNFISINDYPKQR